MVRKLKHMILSRFIDWLRNNNYYIARDTWIDEYRFTEMLMPEVALEEYEEGEKILKPIVKS